MSILTSKYVGERYGRWTVTGLKDRKYFMCACDCGTIRPVYRHSVTKGASKSCGCLSREVAKQRNTVHGCSVRPFETPEWKSWSRMRHRCNNPKATQYKHYGGRGITICKRWDDFRLFLKDVGFSPGPGYTLERKDNNGNYEPCNVRWATKKEQANNTRSNVLLSLNGERMPVSMWAEQLGVPASALYARKAMGWSDVDILTRPMRKLKKHK